MAACTPGAAAAQPPQREVAACQRTVALQRFNGVKRASRLKAAGRSQPGRQQQAVAANQGNEQLAHGEKRKAIREAIGQLGKAGRQ